jgi:hypothetical protein
MQIHEESMVRLNEWKLVFNILPEPPPPNSWYTTTRTDNTLCLNTTTTTTKPFNPKQVGVGNTLCFFRR